MPDYKKELEHINENNMKVMQQAPEVGHAFMDLYAKAGKSHALDAKQKALIALAISISLRCEGCIATHVSGAIMNGASMAEISDVVEVAILMGGGPALVHGGKALEAAEQLGAK